MLSLKANADCDRIVMILFFAIRNERMFRVWASNIEDSFISLEAQQLIFGGYRACHGFRLKK